MGHNFWNTYRVTISHLIYDRHHTGDQKDDKEDKIEEESKFTAPYERAPPVNCREKIVRFSFRNNCCLFDVNKFCWEEKQLENVVFLSQKRGKIFENKRNLGILASFSCKRRNFWLCFTKFLIFPKISI